MSIARDLIQNPLVRALALLPLVAGLAQAGVATHSYGVSGTLDGRGGRGGGGPIELEGCVEFTETEVGANLEGRPVGVSFVTSFTEIDFFFFGIWSTNQRGGGPAPSMTGIHLAFGFFIFGTDGNLTFAGTWEECSPFAEQDLVDDGSAGETLRDARALVTERHARDRRRSPVRSA